MLMRLLASAFLLLMCGPPSLAHGAPASKDPPGLPHEDRWVGAGVRATAEGVYARVVLEKVLGGKGYSVSMFAEPPRLVVDIPDPIRAVPVKELDLKGGVFRRIRFGRHADKLRVVFDLARVLESAPLVQKKGSDLLVQVGRPKKTPAAKAEAAREAPAARKGDAEPEPVRIEAVRLSQARRSSDVTVHLSGKADFRVREEGKDILIEIEKARFAPAQGDGFPSGDKDSDIVAIETEQVGDGRNGNARIRIRLREKRTFEVLDKETLLCVRVHSARPLPELGLGEPLRTSCKVASVPWMEPLSLSWREQVAALRLPGHLFRTGSALGGGQAVPGEGSHPSFSQEPDIALSCPALCGMGDDSLAAGLLPEALAHYKRAADLGCAGGAGRDDPRLGLLRTDLAMGRFVDARRLLAELSAGTGEESEPLLRLADAVLSCFEGRFEQASVLFSATVPHWHLCRNVEGIAGLALARQGRNREARNVFRVARHSPWKDLRDFGTLGLADCYLALDQCQEAEGLYEELATAASPLGWLALAEFRIRQGDFDRAVAALGMLRSSAGNDYWNGVALAYLLSLRLQQEAWASALEAAEEGRAVVLAEPWARYVQEKTVEALTAEIGRLWEAGSHEEIPLIAHRWPAYLEKLPSSAQVRLAKSYESLAMNRSAADLYSRLTADPGGLFQGARLAWSAGEFQTAEAMLDRYLATGDQGQREEAKMLEVILLSRLNRAEAARERLRETGDSGDPVLLAEVAAVEESLGQTQAAIRRYRAALESSGLKGPERARLLGRIAGLYYEQGDYANALAWSRQTAGTDGAAAAKAPEEVEVLSLLKLDKLDLAKPRAEGLQGGPTAGIVREIVAAEDLITTLQRKGYAP
jgi:hypothetical protein